MTSVIDGDSVPIEEWSSELVVHGKVKPLRGGAEAKASSNRAISVVCTIPETKWSSLAQSEAHRKMSGGSNTLVLQNYVMTHD